MFTPPPSTRQLTAGCPRLAEVAGVLVQVLVGATVNEAIQQDDPDLQKLFEGLFSHFFSLDCTSYNQQDCQWFLELINQNLDLSSSFPSSFSLDESEAEQEDAGGEPTSCVSVGIFKLFLTRILGTTEASDGSMVTCPALYKQWVGYTM